MTQTERMKNAWYEAKVAPMLDSRIFVERRRRLDLNGDRRQRELAWLTWEHVGNTAKFLSCALLYVAFCAGSVIVAHWAWMHWGVR